MRPARYIFLNRGLNMSGGKCAAQAAHAETLAMADYFGFVVADECGASSTEKEKAWEELQARQGDLINKWLGEGHYAKYVMSAEDSTQMYTFERYLRDRGFKTYMVIDEGHTEGTYFVPTAMAVELVDKDEERTDSIFGEFKLYRDTSTRLRDWIRER